MQSIIESHKCTVVKIINPAEYLLLSQDAEHISEIKHLEQLLKKENEFLKQQVNCPISPGMDVIVQPTEEEKSFKRGHVQIKVNDNFYQVYLIDYGKLVTVERHRLFIPINNLYNSVEPLVFTLRLYGLLPMTEVFEIWDGESWCQKSKTYVENLFNSNKEIIVKTVLIKEDIVYGDLLIPQENSYENLSLIKLLSDHQFCTISEIYFLKAVFGMSGTRRFNSKCTDDSDSSFKEIEESEAQNKSFESEVAPCKTEQLNNQIISFKVVPFVKSQSISENKERANGENNENFSRSINSINQLVRNDASDIMINSEDFDDLFLVKNPLLLSNFSVSEKKKINLNNIKVEEDFYGNLNNIRNLKTEYGEPFVLFRNANSVTPFDTIKNLNIDFVLKQNLCGLSHFENLSSLQRWIIPAALSGQNVVAIGSIKTGKTLSYIIPVIDLILKAVQGGLPEGNGPLVLVVCSNSLNCHFIYRAFCCLLKDNFKNQNISIVVAHGNEAEEKFMVNLTNGCHILISTPHCLMRLLEMPLITNLERLLCLILDELDILSQEPFKLIVRLILERAQLVAKNQNFQKIVCSRRWTPEIENLTELFLGSYILIIGSYLEAAIYAKLKPKIYFVNKDYKLQILCDEIKKKVGKNKILVACENIDETFYINSYLKERKLDTLVLHEYIMADHHKDIILKWSSSRPLVATDDVLKELKVKDVDLLIHYTIPEKSKTNFFYRYYTILSLFFKGQQLQEDKQPMDLIILDDENHYQLPQIIDYATRLGGNIPDKLYEISNEILKKIEKSKQSRICNNVLRTGQCNNYNYCTQRHVFNRSVDSPSTHPSDGWVSFSIIKVHDASKFSVKLTHHLDINGTVRTIQHFEMISKTLNEFFQVESNRKFLGSPKIGDICAIKGNGSNSELFYRAEVVECIEKNDCGRGTEFCLRLIDEGDFIMAKKFEIFELPFDLAQHSPLTVDVILADIHPRDFDMKWSRQATAFTNYLLTRQLEENKFWWGKIVLAIKNVLFLESVLLKQFLPNIKANVYDFVLEKKILNQKFAVRNGDHMRKLRTLCKEEGMQIPTEDESCEKEGVLEQPRWTSFDDKITPVVISRVENVSCIFLRMKKFENLLEELEGICQMEAEKILGLSAENKKKLPDLSPGKYCLALFGNRWKRGKIESENNFSFKIYFIDHGDFTFIEKKKVLPLPNDNTLVQLPSQAIECSLIGIRPLPDYSLKLVEEINKFILEEPCLYAFVWSESTKPKRTIGPKYNLSLLNSNGKSLNNHLVNIKMVDVVESEAKYLDESRIPFQKKKTDVNGENLNEKICVSENSSRDMEKETLEKEKSGTDLEKYFNHLPDDIFTNENESNFLEEFASKIFPNDLKAEVNDDLSDEKILKSPKTNDKVSKNSVQTSNIYKRLLNLHGISKVKENEMPKLSIRNGILTPQIFWRQDRLKIYLKISLNNVEKYRCDCTTTNFLYRCIADEKFYAVDLKLFGGINPNKVVISLKSFHVDINFIKLCPFLWPRLHRDEGKHYSIHSDLSDLREQEDDFVSKSVEKAKMDIEAGLLKEGIRTQNLLPYTDSENSDDGEESDSMLSDGD